MDIQMIIIGTILGLLCASPFILTSLKKRKKKKELIEKLENVALGKNIELKNIETVASVAVAIDTNSKLFFLLKRMNDGEILINSVELSYYKGCEIKKKTRYVEKTKNKIIDGMAIIFFPNNLNQHPIESIEFFNADTDNSLSGELQLMEKWVKILNS